MESNGDLVGKSHFSIFQNILVASAKFHVINAGIRLMKNSNEGLSD